MSCGDESVPRRAPAPASTLMGVERGGGGGGGCCAGGTEAALNGAPRPERGEEQPPRKRLKLVSDDVHVLRKYLLEFKLLRLKNFRERFTEQLSELYFLQASGNMMDYAAWRKRPPTPQFLAFLETRQPTRPSSTSVLSPPAPPSSALTPSVPLPSATLPSAPAPSASTLSASLPSAPPPSVPSPFAPPLSAPPPSVPTSSAPPVSASPPSELPTSAPHPSVPQPSASPPPAPPSSAPEPEPPPSFSPPSPSNTPPLQPPASSPPRPPPPLQSLPSTQGSLPVIQPSLSVAPPVDVPTPATESAVTPHSVSITSTAPVASAPHVTLSAAEEMVEKAKQEAYVAARVAELARAGLWTERRLPRVMEPPRPKTHWDYLLEEMVWLAQDFAHERKWKKQAAKKCARSVQKYFTDKALAAQKAEKAQELQLKKIASFAAKEIRMFWCNIKKLVEWKRVRRVERARKEALDEQLSYIVDRTERYSRQLAANFSWPTASGAAIGVADVPDALDTPPSDDEFTPRDCSDDDEETIAAAEREAALDAADHCEELEALRRESDLALGDLLPPGYVPAHSPPPSDYGPDADSADDEDTIAEQERAERPEDTAAEVAALQDEAELNLEELIRRYTAPLPTDSAVAPGYDTDASTATEADEEMYVDNDDDDDELNDEHENINGTDDDSRSVSDSSDSEALETLIEPQTEEVSGGEAGEENGKGAAGEQRVEAAASLAASLQPTGTTLSETTVGTPVPRLLRHPLREYQHVGLHWLATMHARGLNGILADEMGLGKTIQTIALLAHLALERRDWGPHLIVAPTSVVLNWEMEFKKWCPAFKILTYYGTIKERKLKRVGWTKANSFHVCITSYKLVVQDHQSFRRKKWKYLILDEAQNIKNFKSQRWQMLLNFQTERRLLLTGTPLQNSLLELWSLMHFLMPDVFASHSEFREWFSPVAGIAEGSQCYNDALVRRLHEVLRPFLLRRLKADVERQMPRKYEHVLMCRLAKRQRYLYDDFMARAKTKESLASGNLLSVINVLMQLRKVCNHPDLFEPRAVSSPLQLRAMHVPVPALVLGAARGARAALQSAAFLAGDLAALETAGVGAFAAHRIRHLAPPRRAFEDSVEPRRSPPRPPPSALRLHLRLVPRASPTQSPGALAPLAAMRTMRTSASATVAPASVPVVPPRGPAARAVAWRRAVLRRLAATNERRCWRLPLYGADLRAAVLAAAPAVTPRDICDLLQQMHDVIDRFSVCCGGVRAAAAELVCGGGGGGGEWRGWRRRAELEARVAGPPARSVLALLHAPAARQAVAFPHPRLLQYDCGKLQTLDGLLRRLKAGGHRVLIFTQMTRVLDVLEAFLSMHGHTYLRLDGATRVEQRQPLVDRFNADPRVFAFILSTRSGGVGLNLTGADCVVFYDSDWNPTMDAQAQDRCHRIGQTRDVHVFRLVTAATVEENILRKAEQKRALGHLAIEDGHFTTSYLRLSNIKELFGGEAEPTDANAAPSGASAASEAGAEGELECALAAAEDEADAAAARAARAEAQGDLAEFDETLPPPVSAPVLAPDSAPASVPVAPSAPQSAELAEFASLMNQLTPIEKYGMRLVESSEAATEAERAALGEMRRQLHEWERARRALRDKSPSDLGDEPPEPIVESAELELTYCRGDSHAKVWLSCTGPVERMPMWCPPTPPSGEGDVYCESWARALYRRGAAAEALLPGITRRDARGDACAGSHEQRRVRAVPRAAHAPPSLFERGGTTAAGGARVRARPRVPPPHREPPQPEWTAGEDAALRRALRLQRLPSDAPAARAPNWDWAADLVSNVGRAYRSPRVCRDRHDALADPERARRKHKKPAQSRRRTEDDSPHPLLQRLDAIREIAVRETAVRRRAALERRLEDPAHVNLHHQALLVEHGVDYNAPPTPMVVATRRADRIAKEKISMGVATIPGPAASPVSLLPTAVPQRILLAAHAPHAPHAGSGASVAGGAGGVEVVRAGGGEVVRTSAQLLYRQQTLAARHQIKILNQSAGPQSPQAGMSSATVAVAGAGASAGAGAGAAVVGDGAALRALQLQQLALRRTAPARPHLVLAQLAPPGVHSHHAQQHQHHAQQQQQHAHHQQLHAQQQQQHVQHAQQQQQLHAQQQHAVRPPHADAHPQ